MEIEVLLELVELILTQKNEVEDFVEDIIEKKFILDEGTLFIATKMRQIELVRFVLNNGVKPTLESFQYAAEHEFFELCRMFVAFGSRKILSTPELEAETRTNLLDMHIENFKNLINIGIDPTANNNCCIQWASTVGHLEIVSFLLEHGADSSGKDKSLPSASEKGHIEIVRLLLEHGADPKANRNLSIQFASHRGHLDIVKLLLVYGADPKDNNYRAIKWASQMGHLEIVRLLLQYGADHNVINSAFQDASIGGHLNIVNFLKEKGADPTDNNNKAIQMASHEGHLEVVRLLLRDGADSTANNNAAIRWASMRGHLEVVRLLLENRADPTAEDNFAIKNASGPDKDTIIALLEQYDASL